MIGLTKINLLPYREEIRKRKQKDFNALIVLFFLIGLGISVFGYFTINGMVNNQLSRNGYLNQEIDKIDKNLVEIKKLQEERDDFLARKQKVEELQQKRFQAASILDTLNVLIPDGVYIVDIKPNDNTGYTIDGKAISDNKIAMFMRSLPSTGLFMQPELLSIKKVDNTQDFTLKVLLNNSNSIQLEDKAKDTGEH